jgi:hypothetical protein
MICPKIELVVSNIDIKTSFAAPRRQVYASKYFSTLYFAPLSSPLSLIQISLLSYPSKDANYIPREAIFMHDKALLISLNPNNCFSDMHLRAPWIRSTDIIVLSVVYLL